MMSTKTDPQPFADYWYDGYDSNLASEGVVYRSFRALPWQRKPLYMLLMGICVLLKPILWVTRLVGWKLIPSLCDGIEYPPRQVPLEAYGLSQEAQAAEGRDAEHYLTEEEILEFNKNGVIGPFQAMSESDASELLANTEEFWGNTQSKEMLKTTEGKSPGLHCQIPDLADIWQSPAVARKLTSLLGDDPRVWRSQFFSLPPGRSGTFWHQATTFLEGRDRPAVLPAPGRRENIAQLTVWCALTPAKRENACLKFLAGSHRIQSLLQFSQNVGRNRLRLIGTVAQRSFRFIDDYILRVIGQECIGGSFFPMKFPVFDEFLKVFSVFFESCEPVTMELKPGEFVIFTSATMHGSWSNTSNNNRVACVARVAGTGADIHPVYEPWALSLGESTCHQAESVSLSDQLLV